MEPIEMTSKQLDDLIARLAGRLGIVFDTEPVEVF
jgi:hypothetical protein